MFFLGDGGRERETTKGKESRESLVPSRDKNKAGSLKEFKGN